MVDNVNHPPHYLARDIFVKCENGCTKHIECIDITRHFNFNLGNAIKYIWRADYKMKAIEDLKKAVWYLQDEIKYRELEGGAQVADHYEVFATFTPENGEGAMCIICQKYVDCLDDHKGWHDKHGHMQPMIMDSCVHCHRKSVDEAHAMFCKHNPYDNK